VGAARALQPDPELYAQVGVFEQNPSNLESGNGFKLSGSGTQGAVMPVELVWSPRSMACRGIPRRLLLQQRQGTGCSEGQQRPARPP
jgi:hypothetical protein